MTTNKNRVHAASKIVEIDSEEDVDDEDDDIEELEELERVAGNHRARLTPPKIVHVPPPAPTPPSMMMRPDGELRFNGDIYCRHRELF